MKNQKMPEPLVRVFFVGITGEGCGKWKGNIYGGGETETGIAFADEEAKDVCRGGG